MGLCLMAMGWADLSLWIAVVEVAVALGFVIFVHELGHFAVAKLCGVKCEKFYLGFDIAGLRLFRFTWGETEYGIGILPLGGYVKMLGQEDNPARLREEVERAKQKQVDKQAPEAASEHSSTQSGPTRPGQRRDDQTDVQATERALFDPRSYLAQSVPKRMAIISAGVIMNLVFAFLTAVIAFNLGVRRNECVVGQTIPGEAAWQENIKIGDRIREVAGRRIEKFRDMQEAVSLGDNPNQGIPIVVQRPGVEQPLGFRVMPESSGLLPRIGIVSSSTTTFVSKGPPTIPGSAAAKSTPKFAPGDTIVEVDGHPVASYAELHARLARHPEKPLKVTVQRPPTTDDPKAEATGSGEVRTIEVPPHPMRRLGLVMQMGPVSAVQKDSPAARAGVRQDDRIEKILATSDDETIFDRNAEKPADQCDPMTLPNRLRQRAGETVILVVRREGRPEPIRLQVTLRKAEWSGIPAGDLIPPDLPVAVPSLGIAYRVLNRVHGVIPGMPAAAAGLQSGDEIAAATLIPPDEQTPEEAKLEQEEVSLKFDEENQNWPALIYALQKLLPRTQVELTWIRQQGEKTETLQPVAVDDWFNPNRGFLLEPLTFVEKADSSADAVRLAAEETVHATLLVYRVLQKLGTRQVSPKALGGPITIFAWLKRAAEQSTSELLITLTLLSANLAVLNFLPIPLLDGGHMVFLGWEAIRGRPADQRVQLVLTYLGLFVILSLMIWVIGLDVVRLMSGF